MSTETVGFLTYCTKNIFSKITYSLPPECSFWVSDVYSVLLRDDIMSATVSTYLLSANGIKVNDIHQETKVETQQWHPRFPEKKEKEEGVERANGIFHIEGPWSLCLGDESLIYTQHAECENCIDIPDTFAAERGMAL